MGRDCVTQSGPGTMRVFTMQGNSTKRCTKCGGVKPLSDFYQQKKKDGSTYPCCWCRYCCSHHRREKYATGHGKQTIKANAMKRKYGICPEEYEAMFIAQGGVCACCGKPETSLRFGVILPLVIDHDHSSGKVRSLLCGCCNAGIGFFKESPELLKAAIAYLEAHQPG